MPATIGVNLRVTGHNSQGGRKYMEDRFSVAYQQTEDEKDLEYAFFGIYDGHGGGEAATYAKEHLMDSIVRQPSFWSEKDDEVLRAIKEGYIATHYAMWKEQANWPKTASGLPSTAGTTATIAFIRHAKIYIGHVGDSGVILGYQEPGEITWKAKPLTKDHKPENAAEMSRIHQCGGKVITKSGVPRVVWNRPRIGHKGPVRRSTPIDEIPFLAVARSLGDLWSYNSARDTFVVSPDPDTCVIPIDTTTFRCLIFGTDGLWNMMSPETAVHIVQTTELHNERLVFARHLKCKVWINPSKSLVEYSLERWSNTKIRADNTTAVTLLLDPPGPPRAEVLMNQRKESIEQHNAEVYGATHSPNNELPEHYPTNGLAIVTRYPSEHCELSEVPNEIENQVPTSDSNISQTSLDHCRSESSDSDVSECESSNVLSSSSTPSEIPALPKLTKTDEPEPVNIQINEVSSSSPEEITSTSDSDRYCKRLNRLGLLKSKPKLLPIGRCTRSQDVSKSDKRTRTVSSSTDISKCNDLKNLKVQTITLPDEFRRNTRAMDRKSAFKSKADYVHKMKDRSSRKRVVPNDKKDLPTTPRLSERLQCAAGEPQTKKSKDQILLNGLHTTGQLTTRLCSQFLRHGGEIDGAGSDQENNYRKLRAERKILSEPLIRIRTTRSQLSESTKTTANIEHRPPSTSSSHHLPPGGRCERNLRERNVINHVAVVRMAATAPAADPGMSTFNLRSHNHSADKLNSRLNSPKLNKAVSSIVKRHLEGANPPPVLRRLPIRNNWSHHAKGTIQTRNRVKKLAK